MPQAWIIAVVMDVLNTVYKNPDMHCAKIVATLPMLQYTVLPTAERLQALLEIVALRHIYQRGWRLSVRGHDPVMEDFQERIHELIFAIVNAVEWVGFGRATPPNNMQWVIEDETLVIAWMFQTTLYFGQNSSTVRRGHKVIRRICRQTLPSSEMVERVLDRLIGRQDKNLVKVHTAHVRATA
jgi:hypothetical protein